MLAGQFLKVLVAQELSWVCFREKSIAVLPQELRTGLVGRSGGLLSLHLPKEDPLPRLPPMGLGMLPLFGRLTGLVLLAGKRLWVGDVGDFTGSAVLGRDERFSGWAVVSSYKSLT